jgi:hypothetical protein
MIGIVTGLGRQIEGDGQAGLALRQVPAVERIRLLGRRMPCVGPKNPGLVALRLVLHPSPIQSGFACAYLLINPMITSRMTAPMAA